MIELPDIAPEPGRPLYEVVKSAVLRAIEDGRVAPGERLPSTKALAEQLSVSLVTVHRAMQELVDDGVLRRGQGKGTFVHEEFGHNNRKGLGRRFGIVFHVESSLADAYHGQIFEGVRQRAHESGADIVLLRFGEDWKNECHGYIYVNPFESQLSSLPRGRKHNSEETPTMVVGANFDAAGLHLVDTDNADMSYRAVAYLAELGHRRIGFVGGMGQVSNDRDRRRGFEQAIVDFGLEMRPEWMVHNSSWRVDEAGKSSLDRLLVAKERPTAIFAAGYYFALDVYGAAGRANLRVPDDLSVVGVDDPPSAAHLAPPLTTFRQPLIEMGRQAADSLLKCILNAGTSSSSAATTQIKLNAEFVERGSCRVAGPAILRRTLAVGPQVSVAKAIPALKRPTP